MKKNIILFLVLTAGLFFYGCSKPEKSNNKKIEIKFWINPWRIIPPGYPADKPVTADAFPKWAAEEFMKKYPEVDIKYVIVSNTGLKQKIVASIASGNPPDIFKYFDLKFAVEGLLEPIDEWLTDEDKNDYLKQSLEFGEYNGKHYMWPWNYGTNGVGASMLIYKERFQEKGIDIDSIVKNGWSISEFLSACRKLSYDENGDGKNDKYAIALGAKDELDILNFLYNFGGRLFNKDETRIVLNSEQSRTSLKFLVDMVNKYKVCVPGVEGLGFYDIVDLFHSHKTAIGFGGPYEIGRIYRNHKSGKLGKVFLPVVVPYPYVPGRQKTAHVTSGGFIVFKQKNRKKLDYIMKFGKFLTSKQTLKLLESLYYVTARKSANRILYAGNILRPEIKTYVNIIEKNGMSLTGSERVHFSEIKSYLRALFETVFYGNKSIEEALSEFEKNANAIDFRVVK